MVNDEFRNHEQSLRERMQLKIWAEWDYQRDLNRLLRDFRRNLLWEAQDLESGEITRAQHDARTADINARFQQDKAELNAKYGKPDDEAGEG